MIIIREFNDAFYLIDQKCVDPCLGACGFASRCQVVNHNPVCSCLEGYEGDPFRSCNRIPVREIVPKDPCPQCGANAQCKLRGDTGYCQCNPEYFGDPYTGCKPECVVSYQILIIANA